MSESSGVRVTRGQTAASALSASVGSAPPASAAVTLAPSVAGLSGVAMGSGPKPTVAPGAMPPIAIATSLLGSAGVPESETTSAS